MIIIIILLIITILSLLLYYKINKQKLEEEIKQNYINTKKKELDNNLLIEFAKSREKAELEHKLYLTNLQKEEGKLEAAIKAGEQTIAQLEKRKKEQTDALNATIKDKKQIVATQIEAFRTVEMSKARALVETESVALLAQAQEKFNTRQAELQKIIAETEAALKVATDELEDYRLKQQAINEAILRQRKIDEQQDFYRVNLSEFAIEDIKLLQEIRQRLHTSDNLNKLIYDVYVAKQVQEMVKRVLEGGAPSGIYKITRLKTGEVYIGKSTNVKDRWVQHCKTVYGAGTIAHSILHTTMQKDGLEKFTFELVEEVPKDKLTEREKYWINFYGSKEYGLNERNG